MPYNPNSIWTSKKKTYATKEPSSSSSSFTPPLTSPTNESELKKESGHSEPPTPPPQHSEPSSSDDRSFFRRHALGLFATGLIVLIGIALGVAYYFRPAAAPSASLTFSQPSSTSVGVPLTLGISAVNNSNVQLTGTILTVVLPDGISFVGDDPSERAKEYSLGDMASGTVVAQSSTIIVTGNPETLERINAKLTYNTPTTAQAQFETDAQTNFLVGDAAIALSYNSPSSIISGQSFTFAVNYHNLTNQEMDNVAIQANFPSVFTFASSSIPLGNNNTWNIGTLSAGNSGSFTVTGTIVGPAQAQYQISETVLAGFSGQNYSVNNQSLSLVVVEPPLSLSIIPNGSSSYVSAAGDSLNYTLNYTNNTNVNFASVKISANLLGSMFDFPSLQTNGAVNSKTNTITWYAANTPELASVAPGQSGAVSFSVGAKSAFPIKLPSDKNYVLQVTGTIQSPTVAPNTAGSSTISVVNVQTKVGGEVAFNSSGYWKSGPYPPKVDQPTYYSIHWAVTNYSTDIKNVTVSAYLQSGSTLAGTMTSTVSSTPSYDSGTGLVTWVIPGIAAGTGIVPGTKPVEADFEIVNTPASNQLGQDVTLIGKTSFASTDSFTGNPLSLTTDPITTLLPDDASVANDLHEVTQ
jgi:hypothetical protein